ncbi:MAG: hypothetical protein JWO67_3816 [Streptosporangiaceae bacterium]|nr:hypothetical protein [Streptosporangiaceae bacterium]
MCESCWNDYEPVPVTPKIIEAARSIKALYEKHGAGGNLHVYVDDWNLPIEADRTDWLSPLDDVERDCWAKMSALTEDEQATALAIDHKLHIPRLREPEDVTLEMLLRHRRVSEEYGRHGLIFATGRCDCGGWSWPEPPADTPAARTAWQGHMNECADRVRDAA